MPTGKQCTRCKVEKHMSEFHRDSSTRDGYDRWCMACEKETRRCRHGNKGSSCPDCTLEANKRLYPEVWERMRSDPEIQSVWERLTSRLSSVQIDPKMLPSQKTPTEGGEGGNAEDLHPLQEEEER